MDPGQLVSGPHTFGICVIVPPQILVTPPQPCEGKIKSQDPKLTMPEGKLSLETESRKNSLTFVPKQL